VLLLTGTLILKQMQLLMLPQVVQQLQEQLQVMPCQTLPVQCQQDWALPWAAQPVASDQVLQQQPPAAAAVVATAESAALPSALTAAMTVQLILWPGIPLEGRAVLRWLCCPVLELPLAAAAAPLAGS